MPRLSHARPLPGALPANRPSRRGFGPARAGSDDACARKLLIAVALGAATAFVAASVVVAVEREAGPSPRGGRGTARSTVTAAPDPIRPAAVRFGGRAGALSAWLARHRAEPAVVTAFASWCEPCRAELPLLARAARRLRGRVAFAAADVDDDPRAARELLARAGVRYPAFRISAGELRAVAPAAGVPATIVAGRPGRGVRVHLGPYASVADVLAAAR